MPVRWPSLRRRARPHNFREGPTNGLRPLVICDRANARKTDCNRCCANTRSLALPPTADTAPQLQGRADERIASACYMRPCECPTNGLHPLLREFPFVGPPHPHIVGKKGRKTDCVRLSCETVQRADERIAPPVAQIPVRWPSLRRRTRPHNFREGPTNGLRTLVM
jgi:hypothetical protein